MGKMMLDINNKVFIQTERILCVMPINSESKRIMLRAEEGKKLIDASGKRRKCTVILMDDDQTVFASSFQPETIVRRINTINNNSQVLNVNQD